MGTEKFVLQHVVKGGPFTSSGPSGLGKGLPQIQEHQQQHY
jgi:hypothetical protein